MEIVHDGWLLKSPPPKRLWRAKWRTRWFVLRSGELPGQYFLEYYTDNTRKKLKGKIDLDQCEQVDAGITFAHRKFEYKYMFDIKTPKRIYYLCAETEEAMNRWVDCVCQVCGLKVMNQEDLVDPLSQLNPSANLSTPLATSPPGTVDLPRLIEYPCVDSPPPSATSTISGPYIPISECITGKKNSSNATRFPFAHDNLLALTGDNQRSSIPNEMAPPAPLSSTSKTHSNTLVQRQNSGKSGKPRESYDVPRFLRPAVTPEDSPNVQSPVGAEGFYVFVSDEDKSHLQKRENSVSSEDKDTQKKRSQSISEAENPPSFAAPPRPPKPPHLAEVVQQSYMNLGTVMKTNVRRNSSSEKSRKVCVPPVLPFSESSVSSSDPEPSPASVSSSTVSSTPRNVFDDLYAFPRSHQAELICSSSTSERSRRHCYNNSGPMIQGKFFSYDMQQSQNNNNDKSGEMDPRISPLGIYSNIPLTKKTAYIPPAVDRGLKPQKTNESGSCSTSELSPPPSGGTITDISSLGAIGGIPAPPSSAPPIVDRNLKPHKKTSEPSFGLNPSFVLDPAPRSRLRNTDQRKPRAAPSPTPPSLRNGRGNGGSDTDADSSVSSPNSRRDSVADEQIFFPLHVVQRRSSHEIQYLDLDLESQAQAAANSPKPTTKASSMSKIAPSEASVVYKKVDFVKTEAFNKMRQNVEEGYRTGKTSN